MTRSSTPATWKLSRRWFVAIRAATKNTKLLVGLITLVAFGLRIWDLNSVPPGWRDDELINSLVISQKALDGDWALYYPDASGHEALYHLLNAIMLGLFGPGAAGIRLLSVILGTLTVPLTYLVANRLFNRSIGLLASAAMAISFWSLMYSRIGIRHISLPVFMLATFYFFLRGIEFGSQPPVGDGKGLPIANFIVAGVFMGLGFYTYFASRGIPLILLAFCVYLWLFNRQQLRCQAPQNADRRTQPPRKCLTHAYLAIMYGLALLMALPLAFTLARQPESEARVEELAVPLVEARTGNFDPLVDHIAQTLGMIHAGGDGEWLYNIPGRPLFADAGALFFWAGVAIALWYSLKPTARFLWRIGARRPVPTLPSPTPTMASAAAFTLIWWLVGISPGFISVPPASLGHTIIAQPAVYVLAALPLLAARRLAGRLSSHGDVSKTNIGKRGVTFVTIIFAIVLLASVARRDLPDYFAEWPNRGMTSFLYRADIKALAQYLNEHPDLTDFGVTGLLAGPWDKLALAIDLSEETKATPRWYNPERALLITTASGPVSSFSGYPLPSTFMAESYEPVSDGPVGSYKLTRISADLTAADDPVCFENGLCLLTAVYDSQNQELLLTWELDRPLEMPSLPLISNPPPPGVYSGPRLLIFAQLLDDNGERLAGDDGLWVDPTTLQPGDQFIQRHHFNMPDDSQASAIIFGLFDPKTGERIPTLDSREYIRIDLD